CPWRIAIDKIVVQGDEGIQQVAVQRWKIDQGPDPVGHVIDVIQALHVREVVLRVKAHILEGGSTFPGHNGSLGCAVYLGVVDRPVPGNQPDSQWHDGFPEAAYFHPVAIHRMARHCDVWGGLHTSHSIVEPDAFADPLLKEPVQLPAAGYLSSTAHIRTGD